MVTTPAGTVVMDKIKIGQNVFTSVSFVQSVPLHCGGYNCLPKGRHSEAAHEKGSPVPKNVPGVGWGGSCMGGWGRMGVGWVM